MACFAEAAITSFKKSRKRSLRALDNKGMTSTVKHQSRGRRKNDLTKGFARRGFEKYLRWLSRPPDDSFSMVEDFVRESRPANPEATSAALLCVLDEIRSWRHFIEGSWICGASHQVDHHYWGQGFGYRRTLNLVERWIRWMHRERGLHEWDLERLLMTIDDYREGYGGQRRRPGGFVERGMAFDDVAACVDEYLESRVCSSAERPLLESSIHLFALRASEDDFVRFGALDVVNFAAELCTDEVAGFVMEAEVRSALFLNGASFYRWLGRSGKLRADRAEVISAELEKFAFGFGGLG